MPFMVTWRVVKGGEDRPFFFVGWDGGGKTPTTVIVVFFFRSVTGYMYK